MFSVLCPPRDVLLFSVMKRHLASHPLPCLDSTCIISSFSSGALCWRGLVDLLIQLLMYNSSYSQLQKSLNGITENVFSLISFDSSGDGAENQYTTQRDVIKGWSQGMDLSLCALSG